MNSLGRTLELALLSGVKPTDLPADSAQSYALVLKVISGEFDEALKDDFVRQVIISDSSSSSGDSVTLSSSSYVAQLPHPTSTPDAYNLELATLAVGVACLEAFLQENWTGPSITTEPLHLLRPPPTVSDNTTPNDADISALNARAVAELSYGGEPAYHLVHKAALLRFSQVVFALPFQHLQFVAWWKLRAMTVQQQLLDEPVGIPDSFFAPVHAVQDALTGPDESDLLGRLILEEGLLHHHIRNDRLAAQLFVKAARALGLEYELTGALGKKTKFQTFEVSQLVLLAKSRARAGDEENKINIAEGSSPTEKSTTITENSPSTTSTKQLPETLALNDDTLLEHTQFTSSTSLSSTSNSTLSSLDPGSQPALHPLDQSVLLSLCLNISNTQPQHGLTAEQMTAYVSRVITHPRNWSIHTMALLLRSRLEATRSRTVERSTFQLQALIDQMPTSDSTAAERLMYIHDIPLPSAWGLKRELGVRYLSLGVVRSAMEIFEGLEMWEEVVKCYQSLEQPEKGIAIVKDLLEGRKVEMETAIARERDHQAEDNGTDAKREKLRDRMDRAREAKLWCLLGDLQPSSCESHYTHAWDISQSTSGRAARSLGGYHVARNEWEAAVPWLRRAVSINPLSHRTWFLLGCACVREEKWVDARDSFARCVSIDEDDAESWNNLASVYLRMGTSALGLGTADAANGEEDEELDGANEDGSLTKKQNGISSASESDTSPNESSDPPKRIPRENKLLAFRALQHGLKYSYDNWRMWENFMVVCMDVGEYSEACRALGRVVEELSEKRGAEAVDLDVLEYLVEAVVHPPEPKHPKPESSLDGPYDDVQSPNSGRGLYPRVSDLFTRTILPRVSSSPRIFRAYARLLTWKADGDWARQAIDAYMNAYQLSVVSDPRVETDLERWKGAVGELEDLVERLRELAPSVPVGGQHEADGTGGGTGTARSEFNWRFQARSMIRSFMARTKETFGDEPEWEKLTELLGTLKGSS